MSQIKLKQVHTSEDRIYLYHLKNILEAQGIDSVVKNDRLASLAGDIPSLTTWPELWVVDNIKEKWAKEIIAEYESEDHSDNQEDHWVCENCGEEHAAQFKDCWNCQSVKAF